ncbi:MAG: hypothetical protein FWE32_12155 [Oscillospiraceae bacterium]|nr:hypothetical protein [Oscillospiraceae bacterium]
MKYMMVILDGIQDISYDELGGKTPLEAARGKNFRVIEEQSTKVRLATTPPGWEPDTLNCVLTLFGLAPDRLPKGRTGVEAVAEGVPVGKEDLVMRCNFVQIGEDGSMSVPCCTPDDETAEKLMAEVTERLGTPLKRIGGYKCIQSFPGGKKWMDGLVTYPPHNYLNKPMQGLLPHGNELAVKLAATTIELLEKYRPYTVFNWGHAICEELPTFAQLHGLKSALINKTLVLEGVAQVMGMTCPQIPGTTGETDTNLIGKAQTALKLLEDHDFVVVHVGGADEATHRQNPVEKAEFIKRVDAELLEIILTGCPDGCKIMFTPDHEAYCSTAGHTDLPVDALLWEKGKVHAGNLGLMDGVKAVPLLTELPWE